VELAQLRCVEAVVRHCNFTRAAAELHLAQSALSTRIAQLERELGTRLFDRTSRRVTPTEAGLAVAERARRVLAELDGVRQEVADLGGTLRGSIRVGALTAAGDIDVAGIIACFGRANPEVEVGLHGGVAADMLAGVRSGQLDFAISPLSGSAPAGISVDQLGWEEVVVAFAPDRAPAGPRVRVVDLAGVAVVGPRSGSAITAEVQRLFTEAGVALQLGLGSADPFLLASLAARGYAAAILPRSLATLNGAPVAIRRFDPPVRLPIVLARRRDHPGSPAARALIEFIARELADRPRAGPARGVAREPGPQTTALARPAQ
jgi:DNA-binding transcriptional LysR family regulator